MSKSLSGPEVPVREHVARLSSKSHYDRTTALAALLKMTQDSTEEEDKQLSPILEVSGSVDAIMKCLESEEGEEKGLALTTVTNLSAGEKNGSILFEDGRLFKQAMKALEATEGTKKAQEQQIRDIAMLCLSNFSVNPSHTTRMVEQGVLVPVIKSVKMSPVGMERHHAVKTLSYISQDAIVREQILPEWNRLSPDLDFKAGANRILKTTQTNSETSNVMELLRNLDILRDWVKTGKPIRDVADFPFCKMLEENYDVIRREFEALALDQDLVAWPERYLCKKGWDVFGLYAFNNRLEENCKKCPETARLLASIPGMTTAMFSCLQPRTHIRPHIGYYQYSNYILRAHLGIKVPEGCALVVNGVSQTWENGKTFVFDDTFRHEAYNKSNELRVVLMIDFKYEGEPTDRNPAFQEASPTVPGGADDALVSPALMAKLSEFVQPLHCKPQHSPSTSD